MAKLPLPAELTRLRRWLEAVKERPNPAARAAPSQHRLLPE
jgi:hypothetical protein